MSEFIRFQCHNCGNSFDLYEKNTKMGMNIVCPHCCSEIPPKQADRCIAALLTCKNANTHFRKRADEYGSALFTASIMATFVPDEDMIVAYNRNRTQPDHEPDQSWQ